jgi:hypothetical protein
MMLFAFLVQAVGGLSTASPHDEALRFSFVRTAQIGHPRITGMSSTKTNWSVANLLSIVRHCGGRGATASRDNGRVIAVRAASTASNLDVARCVKASTSLRFDVGVRERGFTAVAFDETPFRQLWDSEA